MLHATDSFPGFSVDDLDVAAAFYRDVLGVTVTGTPMGVLELVLPGGYGAIAYPKDDHVPATFTVLNFVVADIEVAVDELNAAGVDTKIYDGYGTDERGISREEGGPAIAWFRDPAGNVLSVIEE